MDSLSAYKLHMVKENQEAFYSKEVLNNSKKSFEIFQHFLKPEVTRCQEVFSIIGVTIALKPIGWGQVSIGGLTGTVVDPKVVFPMVLSWCAYGFIMCHNHPSGNLKPSEADLSLTEKFKQGAKILDIKLLDHIIVDGELTDYYSFADNSFYF